LEQWSQTADKPIVLLLDEVDALIGDTLISLLRQLRAGYNQRPQAFPQSLILCGVRDLKDYRIHQSNGPIITGGSAFNIKAKSLRLDNFTLTEIRHLYGQHTEQTGQGFDEAMFEPLWRDTAGQPWLVNALGHEMTWEDRTARDRRQLVTLMQYQAARERLIQSRAVHLDQLADKLKEPRVHRVIAPILAGEETALQFQHDDLDYCEDLGLIRRKPQLTISNLIYQEIIPRELTSIVQDTIVQQQHWYLTEDYRLDMPKLLVGFQQFFRENADSWIEYFDYKEAGPQLLLQAFLQRLINGGGRINREYALGRRRTDLLIEWPIDAERGFTGEVQRVVLELKLQKGDLDKLIETGVEQTLDYADRCAADEAHLIVFNRDPHSAWDDKLWQRQVARQGRVVGVWGC
jgi:hypothetical protein